MEHRSFSVAAAACLILSASLLGACAKAKTTQRVESQPQQVATAAPQPLQPTVRPGVIYVADFDIDSADVKQQKGPLGRQPLGRGVLGGGGPLHLRQNPQATATMLVDTLSTQLVQDLTNNSLPAMRLAPGAPLPTNGWLIKGQFLEVDEGNRLRRAVVGFGAGETNMEIGVQVFNLGSHPSTPFLLLGTQADSGKMPGAVVTLNPYVAAAKFVLSKNASQKDVKHSTSQIASEIVGYMKTHGLMAP